MFSYEERFTGESTTGHSSHMMTVPKMKAPFHFKLNILDNLREDVTELLVTTTESTWRTETLSATLINRFKFTDLTFIIFRRAGGRVFIAGDVSCVNDETLSAPVSQSRPES